MKQHQFNHAKELMDNLNMAIADYESFVAGVNQLYTTPLITLYKHNTKIYEFKISREQASAIIVDEKNRLKEKMEKAKKDF
jgi:hypothetical protein